jgi:Asp-tRNA(Asn)/Glu-tRNA(Gln) amidotransferase A subunit family amidase
MPGPGAIRATRGAIAEGRATAVGAVAEALRRIEERDAGLGAVVALRANEAFAEAEELDRRRQRHGRPAGPLDGVPVLIKDLEDVAGMSTRRGSLMFADARPALADEVVPALLRRAGAVIVGKTNLPEVATEGFTDNLADGPTRNPWNPEFSPGGSSGGSAAALSAGMVPIATATDGGGSVRIPAAMCGLIGLKPTHGAVGRWPAPDWIDLSTYGPMATTVDDLRLLFSLMVGRVDGDPSSAPSPWDLTAGNTSDAPTHLIIAERTSPLGPLPAPVATAFHAAAHDFAALWDMPVSQLAPGDVFGDLGDPDLDWFTMATADHVNALGRDRVTEWLDRMHPATAAFMRMGMSVDIDEYLSTRRRRAAYARRLDELLGANGLLLTPTVAVEGWLADGRLGPAAERGLLPPEVYSTAVQNLTGHPAISLPVGRYANGVPYGLQVTAARWRDDLLLDVADRWESQHPWSRIAPGFDEFIVNAR